MFKFSRGRFCAFVLAAFSIPSMAFAMLDFGRLVSPRVIAEPTRCFSEGNPEGICTGDTVLGPGAIVYEVVAIDARGDCKLKMLIDPLLEHHLARPKGFFLSPRDALYGELSFTDPKLLAKEVFGYRSGRLVGQPAKYLAKAVAWSKQVNPQQNPRGLDFKIFNVVEGSAGELAEVRLFFENGQVLLQPLSFWLGNAMESIKTARAEEIQHREITDLNSLNPIAGFPPYRATAIGYNRKWGDRVFAAICARILVP